MAQTKISQLTELSSIADNDVLAGVDTSAGTTKKVKMSTLKSYINTGDAQDVQINGTSVVSGNVANIAVEGTYNASTNKLETVNDVNSKTGTLSNLTTTDKTNLVSAINELNTNKEENSNKTSTIDENSTNTQYPGAKAVYDLNETTKEDLENELSKTQAQLDTYKTIFNALPKVSGTGESISLDGTAESPLKMDLKGNTYQETTTGANLQKYTTRTGTSTGATYICDNNGQVSITGTATAGATYEYNVSSTDPITLTAGTYTIKVIGNLSSTSSIVREGPYAITLDENQEGTFTLTNDTTTFYIGISINAGSHNDNFYITLVSGTTATTERYTNGIAPNPQFPMPIQVVSGDNSIKICGKNLWGGFEYSNTASGVYYAYMSDGSIFLNGTADNANAYTGNGSIVYNNKLYTTLQPGTYTFSLDKLPENVSWQISESQKDNTTLHILYSVTTTSKTFTLTEEMRINIRFLISNGSQMVGETIKIMLEKGEEPTTYEPYKEQKYMINLGVKNLVNETGLNTYAVSNTGVIQTNHNSLGLSDYIQVKPNTTYSINYEDDFRYSNFYVANKDINGNFIDRTSIGTTLRTFTTGATTYYVFPYIYNSTYTFPTGGYMQITETTKPQSYTPYGADLLDLGVIGDNQDVFKKSTGKNLFSCSWTQGSLSTATGEPTSVSTRIRTTDFIEVNDNTQYVINILLSDVHNTKTTQLFIYEYDYSKTYRQTLTQNWLTLPYTFKLTAGTKYIKFVMRYSSNVDIVPTDVSKSQLEFGTTPTAMEPYGIDKWYKYGMVNKSIIDENTPIEYSSDYNCFFITYTDKDNAKDHGKRVISNYFASGNTTTSATQWVNYPNNSIGSRSGTGNRIGIKATQFATLEAFQTWLSTHPVTIYYAVALPEFAEITNPILIQQLNDIEKALSYKTQTNINQENNDLPFIINAQTLLDISNLENRVTLLED